MEENEIGKNNGEKNKLFSIYIYLTFALAILAAVPVILSTFVLLDMGYIEASLAFSFIWFLSSAIPLVNFILLLIVSIKSKVWYKLELVLGLVLIILELPMFIFALVPMGYV